MGITAEHLTPVQDTLFITLINRAADAALPRPILGDTTAAELVKEIDHDYAKLAQGASIVGQVALRALLLDRAVRRFVAEHPDAVVVDLGAGLDSRMVRIAPPATVDWYDVDFPEVIALRDRLLPPSHTVGASVADPHWLDGIPRDRPTVVVADGLFAFLSEQEISTLFRALTDHFASGELVFNDYGRMAFALWLMRLFPRTRGITDLRSYAGFNDPRTPERWAPRLRLVEETSLAHVPEVDLFPLWLRVTTRLCGHVKAIARKARILRYRF
ncbi:class I SAM-dependent methyltransferase [Allokutzneria oryzae]|uniref:Class I SAM-dependent methyltransferase n=1 Tax=Allokutzneria oryzae TaxID=1378989 RepID=A0ABV5ZUJ9_9PSEU